MYSNLHVLISSYRFDLKWYYESCPNNRCKKTAQSYTECPYCSFQIQEALKRFTLFVEFSDYSGSIALTAFDEVANFLVKNKCIEELISLSDFERK